MKLFIVLAVLGLSNGAKLDNTYLPPANAPTAGGSGNILQTPASGPSEYQKNNAFGQRDPARNNFAVNNYAQGGEDGSQGFVQNTAAVVQPNNFAQAVNAFAATPNNYAQAANGLAQGTGAFVQPNYAQNDNFAQAGAFEARPERARAALERNAAILRQDTQNDGETYAYAYETENGITADENGVATNGVEAQGGFSYVGDDGQVYSIRYTADQNGFVPQGDHLPTPPPVPAEILKALEDNARDEANGIYDDGSYAEGKYGDNSFSGYNENANVGNFGSNQNNYNQGFNRPTTGTNEAFSGISNGNNYNDNISDDDDTIVTNNALLRSVQGGENPAYTQNQGFRNQAGQATGAYNQASFGQRNQPGFQTPENKYNQAQGNQGYNQAQGNQGYNQAQGNQGYNKASFGQRNQPTGNQRQENQYNGFSQNQVSRNQGLARSGSRAYLPPFQRSNDDSSRRQPFNPRTGYQY